MRRANKGRLFAKREETSGGGINLEAPLLSLSGSLIRYTGKHSSIQSGNMRSPRQRLRPRLILLKIKIIASEPRCLGRQCEFLRSSSELIGQALIGSHSHPPQGVQRSQCVRREEAPDSVSNFIRAVPRRRGSYECGRA